MANGSNATQNIVEATQFGLEATVKYILANGEARACVYLCQIQREVVSVTLVHHLIDAEDVIYEQQVASSPFTSNAYWNG